MATFKLNNVTALTESGGTLTFDSAIKYPDGHVIQVIYGSESAESKNTASRTSWTGIGPQAVITPNATTNKVFVQVCCRVYNATGGFAIDVSRAIAGGSTNHNLTSENNGIGTMPTGDQTHSWFYMDSPNTTSACTYKPSVKSNNGSYDVIMGDTDRFSSIVVMEIVGS